jgi:hypothetical protein
VLLEEGAAAEVTAATDEEAMMLVAAMELWAVEVGRAILDSSCSVV